MPSFISKYNIMPGIIKRKERKKEEKIKENVEIISHSSDRQASFSIFLSPFICNRSFISFLFTMCFSFYFFVFTFRSVEENDRFEKKSSKIISTNFLRRKFRYSIPK